jgi:hypothetical protein
MKTILRTSIKDNEFIRVEQSIEEIEKSLGLKGPYIKVMRIEHNGDKFKTLLMKSTIKMVKQSKTW